MLISTKNKVLIPGFSKIIEYIFFFTFDFNGRHKPHLSVSMHLYIWANKIKAYLLYLFWPLRRITKGHEYTVGQNSTHNDHAEKSGELVKENVDYKGNDKHHKHDQNTMNINNTAIKYLQCLYFACNGFFFLTSQP